MTTQTPQSPLTSGPTGSEGGASVRDRATQVGGTAKDEAAGVAQEVKYQARDLVGEARGQVRQQLDTQKGRLSELLRDISDELEQMASGSDRNGIAADLARQAAGRVRDARGYLDGGGDLLDDVRRFARRRPGTFLVGALAAGVLAGRATRAATAARKQQSSGQRIGGAMSDERYGRYDNGYQSGYGAGTYAGSGSSTYPASTQATGTPTGTTGYPTGTTGYPTGTTGYTGATATTAGAATAGAAYPEGTYQEGSGYEAGYDRPAGYEQQTYGTTPSTAPTSGYSAAPTTPSYGTTASGAPYQAPAGATEYQDATAAYDTASEYPPPAETALPPERQSNEDRA